MAKSTIDELAVSAPGRICLFGEHQDYFGLPVIPAAIDLRITIKGRRRSDRVFNIQLPDVSSRDEFSFDGELQYKIERDYLRSVVNVLRRKGITFEYGYDFLVQGDIPINSGISSSSALCVAWVKFLLCIAANESQDNPEEIAHLAYLAEVEEFNEPGGMMDQNSSALGSIICVDFKPEFRVTKLPAEFGTFVLGDSLQEKDTRKTLARIKSGTLSVVEKIQKKMGDFDLTNTNLEETKSLLPDLAENERLLLEGAMTTRDITRRAKSLLLEGKMDDKALGHMLNEQQDVIRDKLRVSTPKLDAMIDAAIGAGALGGKVSGSGEGGCMFAYAPISPGKVAVAIERVGGKPYVIRIGEGVRRE